MSEALDRAIDELKAQLEIKLQEVAALKSAINQICTASGKPPMFTDTAVEKIGGALSLKPDQFYGKPLATAVRDYLTMKGSSAGADEIYDALKRGGFGFSGGSEEIQKRNLRISFGKNPAFVFIKGSNTFGLVEKYGVKKKGKDAEEESEEESAVEGNEEAT